MENNSLNTENVFLKALLYKYVQEYNDIITTCFGGELLIFVPKKNRKRKKKNPATLNSLKFDNQKNFQQH